MKEREKEMYYGASSQIFENSRLLRKSMTETEKLLWNKIKGKQLAGVKFRRQHPTNKYIVDFYCHEIKLAIEIDGIIHKFQKDYDEGRTSELEKFGIKVIRFDNNEILNNLDNSLRSLNDIIKRRLNLLKNIKNHDQKITPLFHPSNSPKGENQTNATMNCIKYIKR